MLFVIHNSLLTFTILLQHYISKASILFLSELLVMFFSMRLQFQHSDPRLSLNFTLKDSCFSGMPCSLLSPWTSKCYFAPEQHILYSAFSVSFSNLNFLGITWFMYPYISMIKFCVQAKTQQYFETVAFYSKSVYSSRNSSSNCCIAHALFLSLFIMKKML